MVQGLPWTFRADTGRAQLGDAKMLRGNGLRWEGPSKTTRMGNAQLRAWFLLCFSTIVLPVKEDMIEFLNIKVIADRETRDPYTSKTRGLSGQRQCSYT